MSSQDKCLPLEPPARRRGKGRARGRPRGAGRRRQRDLQEDEPAEQDDVDAEFVAEAPQGAVPIPPAVPQMQPMFQQGVQGMLYPVAVVFYAREGGYQNTQNMTFQIGSSNQQRGTVHQEQRQQPRYHRSRRHGHGTVRRPIRFKSGATSSSSR